MKIFKTTILIAALMSSSSALANPSGWRFSEVSGSVTVTRDGRVLVARDRAVLHEGDEVRTAASSRAVLVRGEEYVVVSPRSHIQIARPQEAGVVTQVIQYLGNALFNIEKKSTPHFGVETPYMAAVVKGTTFNVSVTEEGTSVQVTEGAVEVATGELAQVPHGQATENVGIVSGRQVQFKLQLYPEKLGLLLIMFIKNGIRLFHGICNSA